MRRAAAAAVLLCPALAPAAGGSAAAGYTEELTYYMTNSTGLREYLALLAPLARYVAAEEPTTLTYRPFVSMADNAVRVISRFNSYADFKDVHEGSREHDSYMAKVAAWNTSTGYVIRKTKGPWNETELGALTKRGETGRPAGYGTQLTYYFQDASYTAHYLELIAPLAQHVATAEAGTLSYRPFVSDDGASVRLLSRFHDYASYADVHTKSAEHVAYINAVTEWNASTGCIAAKTKGPWNETDMGVFAR